MKSEVAAKFLQATILDNPYIPWQPHPQQAKLLLLPHREALFGGAAGGGKTVALLMAALQFVHIPGYNALILRKTFPMLSRADSPIPLSHEWLRGTDAKWEDKEHRWRFPSGATVQFGHLQHEKNKYDYQGAAFQFIAFDELTHFTKPEYTYLLSRLRKKGGLGKLPLRMRNSANPGGIGHEWVKGHFITSSQRPFIPSKLQDNPSLDQESYIESLMGLDPYERNQLLHGDWDEVPPGDIIEEDWFQYVDYHEVPKGLEMVQYYDLAGTSEQTAKEKKTQDPDYTARAKVGEKDGILYILEVDRKRLSPLNRDVWMRRNAKKDPDTPIWIEQDPGQAGISQILSYQRDTLSEYEVRGNPKRTKKVVYWSFLASKMEAGLVRWVRAPWNWKVEQELCALTRNDSHGHDDMADAISGGVKVLLEQGGAYATWEASEDYMAELEEEEEDQEDEGFAFA